MQASILGLSLAAVLAMAGPANAQTGRPAPSALARLAAEGSGDAALVRASLGRLGEAIVGGYVAGAGDSTTPVDRPTLDEALQASVSEDEPAFVNAVADAYGEVYTPDELHRLVAYYRSTPDARDALPEPLSAKSADLRRSKALRLARLGPRFAADIFRRYCSRAVCSDHTKSLVAGLSKGPTTP